MTVRVERSGAVTTVIQEWANGIEVLGREGIPGAARFAGGAGRPGDVERLA
jgi:hypothetical protein